MEREFIIAVLGVKREEYKLFKRSLNKTEPIEKEAIKILGTSIRPGGVWGPNYLNQLKEKTKIKILIDDIILSCINDMHKASETISDKKRSYTQYSTNVVLNSLEIADHFGIKDFTLFNEALITAKFLIDQHIENTTDNEILNLLGNAKQENLDIGVVLFPKYYLKPLLVTRVLYNMHIEFKRDVNGEVIEIHIHLDKFPRIFKFNRQGLIKNIIKS